MLAAFFHFFGAFCFHLGLMLLPWIWHFFFNLNSIIFLFVLLPLLGLIDSVDFYCFSALHFNAFCSLLVDFFDAAEGADRPAWPAGRPGQPAALAGWPAGRASQQANHQIQKISSRDPGGNPIGPAIKFHALNYFKMI